jgi:NADPH2:quinone reductase
LQEGESTLIHAGAGGIGHIAIQLAHYLNAPVATTISNPETARFTQALGARR